MEVIEEDHYYPFGLKHKIEGAIVQPIGNAVAQNYKYNGKEFTEALGLDWYDYGARNYNPAIGRWSRIDNKAELYFATSPYVYALNTPLQAVDPDGNLVIFINGLGGGGASYWRSSETIRYMTGTESFVGFKWQTYGTYKKKIAFDSSVMTHFGDYNARYIDGSPGSLLNNFTSGQRFEQGYQKGKEQAAEIIGSLARDTQGNITESIKIITHSMGGVYGKGFVAALKYYIRTSKDPQVRKVLISLVADFDPFQAGGNLGKADKNIYTQQFINAGWSDIFNAGWLANQEEEEEADDVYYNENKTSHFIETFLGNIDDLQEGKYEWNDDEQQWICTTCKND
nr:RHS repeat-associated core domain-containing protein [Flavobacterium sp. SaA2.13]